jgi:hypothetical protein
LKNRYDQTGLQSIGESLRAQLSDTIRLAAYVQRAELNFRAVNGAAADLVRSLAQELSTIAGLIESRVFACGQTRVGLLRSISQPQGNEDFGNLEDLLSRFCKYARNTSERRVGAEQSNDDETIILFDRILTVAHRGVWFLDIYSNAIWLKSRPSRLPKWKALSTAGRSPAELHSA